VHDGPRGGEGGSVFAFGDGDSDDDLEDLPTWTRDIQPYVHRKYEQAFGFYKGWQERQMKEFAVEYDKKMEQFYAKVHSRSKDLESNLEVIQSETHCLLITQ
jgi:hypothetical protein